MASLKSFTKPEDKGRVGFSIPASALREFAQYTVYIQAREGFEVERGDVLAEVIKAWAGSDRDYQKWVEVNGRDSDMQARVNKLLKAEKDTAVP